MESLQPVLETFRYHNSQKRDLRDSDEGEDEKLHNQSHDWDDFYSLFWDSSKYSPILLYEVMTSRPAGLLMNLNKLLMSELSKYLW